MSHELASYIDVTKNFYEQNATQYAANTAGMADAEWMTRFSELLPTGGRILDVGCAAGRDSKWFVEHGFDVVGIDIAPKFLAMARERVTGVDFQEMNVADLDFPDASFDGVWCSCVLIHLNKNDARVAVSEMLRVLKPDGILYLLVKAGETEGFEADQRYGGAQKYSSYFTEEELRDFLGTAKVLNFTAVDKPVDTYRAPDRIFLLARRGAAAG